MDLDDPANPFETHRRMRIIHRRQEEMANVPNYETTNDTQSLYGWAPSPDNDDSERGESRRNNDTLNAWHRTLASRHPSLRNHLEEADRNSPLPDETANNEPDPFTLTAVETLFQAVRRQPRFNRARALQNYLSERDPQPRQSQTQNHSPNRPYRLLSNRGSPSDWPRGCPHSYRRSQMGGQDRPRLKDAIRYLHKLQYADSYKDSLDYAVNFGFTPNDNPTSGNQDLVLDTASITLPTECSWLRPGMVFSGSQKAAHSAASIYSRRMPGQNSLFHYIDNRDSLNGRLRDENWPVKVTIHDINYEDMTLSGTMEAYNIPDKTYPSHDAHIVTFLEGEIIDFNTHTLETMNFKSSVEVDSTYWRQLHPFKGLTDDDELVSSLVSRKWINEQLAEHWVLMRWKG